MMDTGEVNHIHISQVAYHHLATDDRFVIERCQQTNVNRHSDEKLDFSFSNHSG